MSINYLESLNPAQREAVVNTEGPSIIIAGAGSGKTRVLTVRIAHLLKEGADAFRILALTFTNKAAREMKERIAAIVGDTEARNLWMGTFHSVFARILRAEAEKLGYMKDFTIYDNDDSRSLIRAIVKERNLDDKVYGASQVLYRISSAKNSLIDAAAYLADESSRSADVSAGRQEFGTIFKIYSERCFRANAMDFDDLLLNTHRLLSNFPDVLHRYQHKFKYVLVDEYQDTNHAQYAIVKKLANAHQNICVVGDDAQSIYSFRGATIQNILHFEKDYPELQTYRLEQNYRSTATIVNAANSLIEKNRERLPKTVWTENEDGEKIRVVRAATDNEEGLLTARGIFEMKMNGQMKNSDFAILYRTNAQSRAFEEALRKKDIPYRIYGGLSFYQRKEVKDLLAYFRVTVNPGDEEALKRTINYPHRGIGKTTIERAVAATASEGAAESRSLWQVLENAAAIPGIGAAAAARIEAFITMIRSFRATAGSKGADKAAEEIAGATGMLRDLATDRTPEGISRQENIRELLAGIRAFAESEDADPVTGEIRPRMLADFLQDVALLTDADKEDGNSDKVSLMTVHAAKGLEFPCVFVVGLEENLFPSQLSVGSREEVEEERRLFYVALTRAEKHAVLSFATSRYRWGNLIQCEPSRFLEEIDGQYLHFPMQEKREQIKETVTGAERAWRRSKTEAVKELNRKLSRLTNTSAPAKEAAFDGSDTDNLQSGMEVEHQRFGHGKVLSVEGAPPNRKATVFFPGVGQKQLLLRFAKLKIC